MAVINSSFFFPRFYRPSWVQLERLLRGPRPVTDRFPAPRSSTHTPSSIMPQHPPRPPSDCASTHSVGTDTDPGIYACYTVMMVNRPILDRYNEDGSGPAKVADSTRTHMAAGQRTAKERINVAILNAPSHTHRGQPANTNYCKGQASENADAVLQKKDIITTLTFG